MCAHSVLRSGVPLRRQQHRGIHGAIADDSRCTRCSTTAPTERPRLGETDPRPRHCNLQMLLLLMLLLGTGAPWPGAEAAAGLSVTPKPPSQQANVVCSGAATRTSLPHRTGVRLLMLLTLLQHALLLGWSLSNV